MNGTKRSAYQPSAAWTKRNAADASVARLWSRALAPSRIEIGLGEVYVNAITPRIEERGALQRRGPAARRHRRHRRDLQRVPPRGEQAERQYDHRRPLP